VKETAYLKEKKEQLNKSEGSSSNNCSTVVSNTLQLFTSLKRKGERLQFW
jgi:hypothetical protein